jgi:hypothetical protein
MMMIALGVLTAHVVRNVRAAGRRLRPLVRI